MTDTFARVYWITGLPGAGKTTIAKELKRMLGKNAILLDGDELREMMRNYDYSLNGRKNIAEQYGRLARLISSQGFQVVLSTVSMFHSVHAWNRINIPNYFEVYLKVPEQILCSRNKGNLYADDNIDKKHIYGAGLSYEEPLMPDLLISDSHLHEPKASARRIYKQAFCSEFANHG